jgi:hypothetical protein
MPTEAEVVNRLIIGIPDMSHDHWDRLFTAPIEQLDHHPGTQVHPLWSQVQAGEGTRLPPTRVW